MRHVLRSDGLLRLEASHARVSQSSLKTGGGVMTGGERDIITEEHRVEAKDGRVTAMGCIGLFYLNFTIFFVLGHKGSLIISFPINRTPRASREASIQPSLSHPLSFRSSFC
jgi:hypothetical protein